MKTESVPGRIPSLDGLRAVSIALVMWAHYLPTVVPRSSSFWIRTAREATAGVDVFFVISGFLITLLLLREEDRAGSISLGKFFARRALRLLPAFAAYLGFVAIYAGLGYAQINATDWALATTYTADVVPFLGRGAPWVMAHLWSLSVEEHFYLAWPVALVLLGRRRAVTALWAVIALSPAMRAYLRDEYPWPTMCGLLKFFTLARLDSIAAGCLLAFHVQAPEALHPRRPDGRQDVVRWGVAAVFLASAAVLLPLSLFEAALRPTLRAALIVGLVHYVVTRPASPLGRVLNARPMAALGVLSYSLYLWQQPFADTSGPIASLPLPARVALALAAATASHRLIERPFLRIKDRIGRAAPRHVPRPHVPATSTRVGA